MTIKNLWGEINNLPKVKSPVVILNEQAQQLEELTGGLLIGRVKPLESNNVNPFAYMFSLNAPSLNNYSYAILRTYHDIGLYPLYVTDPDGKNGRDCNNMEEFESELEKTLSSPEIRRVISGLLSQIQTA